MNTLPNRIQITPVLAGNELPVQVVDSIVDAFTKFENFSQQHAELLSGLKENWSDEERAYRVGFSVEFRRLNRNETVVLHATNEGGIALCQRDNRLRLTKGSFESKGIVAFLHPEWTEFEVSELCEFGFLMQAMKQWNDTGMIPLEYLR